MIIALLARLNGLVIMTTMRVFHGSWLPHAAMVGMVDISHLITAVTPQGKRTSRKTACNRRPRRPHCPRRPHTLARPPKTTSLSSLLLNPTPWWSVVVVFSPFRLLVITKMGALQEKFTTQFSLT